MVDLSTRMSFEWWTTCFQPSHSYVKSIQFIFVHPKYWPRHNWQLINLLCWSYGFPDCPPSSSSPIDTSLPVISISCSIYVVNFSLHLHNVRTVELHNVVPIPPILIQYCLIRQYGPYIPSVHLCFLPNNNFNRTLGGLLGWFPLYKLRQMSTFYKIHMYHHQTSVWLDFDSAMILSPRLVLPPPVFVVKTNNSTPYTTTVFVSHITPRTW